MNHFFSYIENTLFDDFETITKYCFMFKIFRKRFYTQMKVGLCNCYKFAMSIEGSSFQKVTLCFFECSTDSATSSAFV